MLGTAFCKGFHFVLIHLVLMIGFTQITGTIPTEMAALTRMEFFAARNVSGLVGCIPFGPIAGDIDGSGLTSYCFA